MALDMVHIERRTERLYRMKYHSGRRHKWKRTGHVAPLFYSGKINGGMMLQEIVCALCGLTRLREELKINPTEGGK